MNRLTSAICGDRRISHEIPWITLAVAAVAVHLPLAAEAGPHLTDLVDHSGQHRRGLADFIGASEPISLEGTRSSLEIEIPMSPRVEILGGGIDLLPHRAMASGPGLTRLRMSWDDQEIGTALLGGDSLSTTISGRISPSRESVSSHFLRIAVERNAPGDNADPGEGILWTQIDVLGSSIALDYRLRPLDPMLDELHDLIDDRFWGDYRLSVLTAPRYAIGADHLSWGSRVAQRAALWMGSRPLEIRHDDRMVAGCDQIAVGTRAELLGILPASITDQISTSFVGIYPHPDDDRQFLLVLSGTETAGVERAVTAFAFLPEQMPALPRVDVTGWEAGSLARLAPVTTGNGRVLLPDLNRWRTEGIPGSPSGPGFDLCLTDRSSHTLAAAWMLVGKLAQVRGDLLDSVKVTDRAPEPGRHWMAIGPARSIESGLVGASPLGRLGSGLAQSGVITQFESPLSRGLAGGILTAGDPLLLSERMAELIRPDLWNALHGDTVMWDVGGQNVRQQRLSASFEVGRPGWLLRSWRQVSGLPWLSILFASGGLTILFWLVRQPMTSGADWDELPARSDANRRVSKSRRLRETARRKARLENAIRRGA